MFEGWEASIFQQLWLERNRPILYCKKFINKYFSGINSLQTVDTLASLKHSNDKSEEENDTEVDIKRMKIRRKTELLPFSKYHWLLHILI